MFFYLNFYAVCMCVKNLFMKAYIMHTINLAGKAYIM